MLDDSQMMVKAMFGEKATHIGFNMIIQDAGSKGDNKACGFFQTTDTTGALKNLLKDKKLCHQLILGDMIIRPHMILDSDHLKGCGLAGLATASPLDWQGRDVLYLAGERFKDIKVEL